MFRRLMLTCAVLIFESAASITLFVLGLALMTVVFERETSPYHNRFLGKYSCECRFVKFIMLMIIQLSYNLIADVLSWQIVGAILAMLLVDVSCDSADPKSRSA